MAKKNFSTSIKFSKYRSFLKNLTGDQKAAVRSCGFGSLLHFDYTEAPRSVAFMLAKRFHVPTRTVKLQNGAFFELNPFIIYQILGVPLGGRKIRHSPSHSEKEIIANDTGTTTVAPTVEELFNLVTSELTGDKFVRIFLLISLSIFLCPTSYGSASKHYYSAIAIVEDISKYDWSSFILDWLVKGIEGFQKSAVANTQTSTLGGCIFVLVVAYFEYIKTPNIVLHEQLPQIKIWDDWMIQEFLALEGNNGDDTLFGLFELKDPSETPFVGASVTSTCFSRLPAQVESFIDNLGPHNDQSNVRSQIRDMCSNFHREIMAPSLAAIQPVVSRQLCSMAEFMWNGLQNHSGADTSAAETPFQMGTQIHTEDAEGVTTRSRSKKKHTAAAGTRNKNVTELETGKHKTTGGRDNSGGHLFASPAKKLNDDVEPSIVDGKAALQQDKHATSTGGRTSNSDPISIGTINCAQPFTYRTPKSVSFRRSNRKLWTPTTFYGSNIKTVVKGKHQPGSAGTIGNVLHEVVPDSLEAGEPPRIGRKRKFGVVSKHSKEIYIHSDSSSPKKMKLRQKVLVDSKKISPHYANPTATSEVATPIVDVADSNLKKPEISTPGDNSVTKQQTVDATPQVEPPSLQIVHAPIVRGSSKMFARKRAQKIPIGLATQSTFFNWPEQKVEVSRSETYVYNMATRRLSKAEEDARNIVAQIGRFYVDESKFKDSFVRRGWVGSFVMDVFCEAQNADNSLTKPSRTRKCFLTSDIVLKLKES